MMSSEAIQYESKRAAAKAAKNEREPLIAFEDGDKNLRYMPFLGDYVPDDWEQIDTLFVDSSGSGGSGEPALTQEAFYNVVKAGLGYAITESGQFQVYVGIYKRR